MRETTKMDDYKKGDTWDFKAYHKARVDNGEECYSCGSYMLFGPKGSRSRCGGCERFEDDNGEVSHDRLIRCPACGGVIDIDNGDLYELYEEGDHDVICTECEYGFVIATAVSYSFRSPERSYSPER